MRKIIREKSINSGSYATKTIKTGEKSMKSATYAVPDEFIPAYTEISNKFRRIESNIRMTTTNNLKNPSDYNGLCEALQETAIRFLENPELFQKVKTTVKGFLAASAWNYWKFIKRDESMRSKVVQNLNDIDQLAYDSHEYDSVGYTKVHPQVSKIIREKCNSTQKKLFFLYFYSTKTIREIAKILRKTRGYVEYNLHLIAEMGQPLVTIEKFEFYQGVMGKSTTIRHKPIEYENRFKVWKLLKKEASDCYHINEEDYTPQEKAEYQAIPVGYEDNCLNFNRRDHYKNRLNYYYKTPKIEQKQPVAVCLWFPPGSCCYIKSFDYKQYCYKNQGVMKYKKEVKEAISSINGEKLNNIKYLNYKKALEARYPLVNM